MITHSEALLDFNRIQTSVHDEREQNLKDRRFYSIQGAQWEGMLKKYFKNKPMVEVNFVHLAVIRIFNDYLKNRISVDFKSATGKKDDELADVLDGLHRSDEQNSKADEAYDNAFEEAVGGGIGAFRLRADYEDEYDDEDDRQRIFIEPIFDADNTVFFDLGSKLQDKSDAKRCYVLSAMDREEYKEKYDDDPATWPHDVENSYFDWSSDDSVYIAELYEVDESTETVHIYKSRISEDEVRHSDSDFENDPDLKKKLKATGFKKIRSRKVKRRCVYKQVMSGGKIIFEQTKIAGSHIPIIMVFGKRWIVDNVERSMGHVRLSKDAQRLKNVQLSKLAEIASLSPNRIPIFIPEQVAGHQELWRNLNTENLPYALTNKIEDKDGNIIPAGPVAYVEPPTVPPALAATMQTVDIALKEILGDRSEGEKIRANVSGEAISNVQEELAEQSFIYLSNFAKGIKWSGEVWLSIAKDIYVEHGREMKLVGKQQGISSIKLFKPRMEVGKVENSYDISKAKHQVVVSVGPNSKTKRNATVKSLTVMMQTADPETQQILSALIMMNMEGEGVSDAREYYRKKLVRMGVVVATEDDKVEIAEEQKNAPPDPNTTYLLAEAEKATAQAKESEISALAKLAGVEKIKVEIENTQAKTIEILANIDAKDEASAISTLKLIHELYPATPKGENVGVE